MRGASTINLSCLRAVLPFENPLRSRPDKPNQRKGQNEKFMNLAHFVNSGVFPWENKHDSH